MCRLFQLSDKEPDVRFFHFLFWKLLTKHNFDKVFPVPQFTFNHNNLSYNYGYSTETIYVVKLIYSIAVITTSGAKPM